MEYSLVVLVLFLVVVVVWQSHQALRDAKAVVAEVIEHAEQTQMFLAQQQTMALELMERVVLPRDVAPADYPQTELGGPGREIEIPWDPTDADPYLNDQLYAPFVPKQQFNDAPPLPTHPMGIPGLEVPYPHSSNGHGVDTRVDL